MQAVATLDDSTSMIKTQVFETWVVETGNINIQAVDLLDATGVTDGTNTLPITGGTYTVGYLGTSVYCKRVQPTRATETPVGFEVEVEYAIPQTPPAVVKLSLGGVAYSQVTWFDKDNKAIVNSAGQPFDPSLTKVFYDMKIGLSWQTITTPPVDLIFAALGNVNSDTVVLAAGGWSHTFTQRQLKLEDASVDFDFQGGQLYWSVSLSMLARSDMFVDVLLDQGYATADGSGNLTTVTDESGAALNAPVRLNGSGGLLAFGATPVYITFKVEPQVAFDGIIATIP
jgi:hypothetical protein